MFKILLILFTFTLSQAASAYKLIKGDEFDCVQEVLPASGLPNGIVTDRLESSVYVNTCDGEYMMLSLNNDVVALINTNLTISPNPAKPQENQLLDSEVTSSKKIKKAWLTGSTRRYRHNILGDDVEASGLAVIDRMGNAMILNWVMTVFTKTEKFASPI